MIFEMLIFQIVGTFLVVSAVASVIYVIFGLDTTYKASAQNLFNYIVVTGVKLVLLALGGLAIFRIWFPDVGRIF